MELDLATFHRISSACNSTSVEAIFSIREQNTKVWNVIYPHAKFEKAAPVTIEMFDQVKLTTSTKVSSLQLVTTGGVLTLKATRVVSNRSFNRIQEMTALTLRVLGTVTAL